MNDIPVFPVSTPQAFYEQLVAAQPDPATGKPDPARMKAFLAAASRDRAGRSQLIKATPVPSGFANATYNSLNAFRFVDAAGNATPGPLVDGAARSPSQPRAGQAGAPADKNYLFDELDRRDRAAGPLQWHLIVTVGQPGDPTNDATAALAGRPRAGRRRHADDRPVESEDDGQLPRRQFRSAACCPPASQPSDDPLLSARSAAYSRSFTRRAGEPKTPSAVQIRPPAEARSDMAPRNSPSCRGCCTG